MQWSSFHRARRFGPPPLGSRAIVYVASVFAAFFVVVLLLLLGATADLLTHRGNLSVAAQSDELRQLAGPPDVETPRAEYRDRGLLPLAWRLHGSWIGGISDAIFSRWSSLGHNQSCLLTIIVLGWTCALLFALTLYVLEYGARLTARGAVQRFRYALYHQSARLGAGDLLLGQKQDVVDLFVDKIETLSTGLLRWSRAIPQAAIVLVALIALVAYVEVWLTLAALLLAVSSRLMLEELRGRSRRRAAFWHDLASHRCRTLVEDLRQVRSLGNFAATTDSPVEHSFVDRLRHCQSLEVRRHITAAGDGPGVLLFILIGAWLILFLGGLNVLREPPRITFSGIVLLSATLAAMLYPVRLAVLFWRAAPAADQAASEILAYLDRHAAIAQTPDARPLPRPVKQIALVSVTLADANGHKLLNEMSVVIPCGGRTTIIASDHETPLAVAGLIGRFYDPAAGRVLFDGHDIGRVTLASLRNEVAMVMPERILITGTVTENIACGDPRFSPSDVIDAARRVLAYDFIQRLPHGFDTIVGEHGVHLTEAESILIGMARAVLRNPAVVILGESTIQYDAATEERLLEATNRLSVDRTIICIARRIATLRSAERVLLFHQGKLHGDGSHTDLLSSHDLYRHLNYVRFNEFRDKVSGGW